MGLAPALQACDARVWGLPPPCKPTPILAGTRVDTNIASVGRLVYNLKGTNTRTMRRFDATGTLSQAPADLSTQP